MQWILRPADLAGRFAPSRSPLVVGLVTLLACPPVATAEPGDGTAAVPGQLVVGFDESSSRVERSKAVGRAGASIEESLESIDGAVLMVRRGTTAQEALERLSNSEAVEFVEPNYVLRASRIPNDLSFNRLWGLHNTGQLGGTAGADISATEAWDVITGGDVSVAIIDTGIDYRHTDLDGNIWTNPADPSTASTTTGTASSTTCAASTSPTATRTRWTTRATARTSPGSSARRATTRSGWPA